MTTDTLSAQQRAAVRLSERQGKPANLWLDAWRRLIRNRMAMLGGLIVILVIAVALFAPQVAPYHYTEGDSFEERTVPSWLAAILPGDIAAYAKISSKFLLGSDFLGRDILSRLIYGTRVSLPVGFMGATTALLIGIVIGCISGYYGGIMYAFPTMLLIILMMAFFKSTFASVEPGTVAYAFNQVNNFMDRILGLHGGGMLFIFMGIGITAWMGMARLTRGQILSLKEKEFIEAAHMIGAGDIRIIIRHLSFIGLGVDPPTPSWGAMISDGARAIRSYPHLVLFPALALALTMFAFNFLGDGLRDALDPKMKGSS